MGKIVNLILGIIIVFLMVVDVSYAWNFRKLADSPPIQHNNTSSDSPISSSEQSSPVGKEKKNGPPPASTPGKDSSKDKQVKKDMKVTPPPVDVKDSNDNSTSNGPVKEKEKESEGKGGEKEKEKAKDEEEQKEKGEEKEEQKEEQKEKEEEKEEQKEKGDSKTDVPVGGGESCDVNERRCDDLKAMTACIKSFDSDSKALVLLIQNKGHNTLKVNITSLSSGNKHKIVNIPKLQSQQVDTTLPNDIINEISLTAGNGNCVLHLGAPVSEGNLFRWMPSFSKFMTPIYGAYLILAITFISGGVWACCWFTKRKGHREVPYQELEMSRPESAVAVESAEGWDEVWDDDWDEENAVRSPGGHSISANGLSSRNPKKDEWEDWDD